MVKFVAIVNVVAWSAFWVFGWLALGAGAGAGETALAVALAAAGGGVGLWCWLWLSRHDREQGGLKRPVRGLPGGTR